ncbi:hypothetical protein DICVIV_02723 [Dictyocaulus viviparus]|uniref:LSM domain-containing protein n=1 Tax=Dictyocaulus viviparus TaxID=29172 RepID=A0A0D8Y369_DICVI|nr:hypothetical protein DICVIV_02723 [Dictyocaulus viviparus]
MLNFDVDVDAIEYPKMGDPVSLGMVVIRGNSVVIMEPKERISCSIYYLLWSSNLLRMQGGCDVTKYRGQLPYNL